MPSFTSIALLSLAAIGAVAAPAEKRWGGWHHGERKCVSDAQADQVATAYAGLIEAYTDSLADAVLTDNFTDYSESVNTLINSCPQGDAAMPLPLLAPTFSSREMFKRGQGQQPPINFMRLNLWHSCDTVIIRWMTTNTANITDVKPVVGLISMELAPNADSSAQYPWLIDTVYSEFDAGAWLQNLVEAGICSTNAGLPEAGSGSGAGNATCSGSAPVAPPASASASASASYTWAPVSSSSWVEAPSYDAPTATIAPSSSAWAPAPESTTDCEDETSTYTSWATETVYPSQTAYA